MTVDPPGNRNFFDCDTSVTLLHHQQLRLMRASFLYLLVSPVGRHVSAVIRWPTVKFNLDGPTLLDEPLPSPSKSSTTPWVLGGRQGGTPLPTPPSYQHICNLVGWCNHTLPMGSFLTRLQMAMCIGGAGHQHSLSDALRCWGLDLELLESGRPNEGTLGPLDVHINRPAFHPSSS